MVSVIIPVYNQGKKLIDTLDSLLKQSYQDFEIIIVNDASDDNVENRFEEFVENNEIKQKILFLSNQKNLGAPASRNKGYEKSKGNYILFCDADAILKPQALKTMVSVLDNNKNIDFVYSSFKWGKKLFKLESFSLERLKKAPFIHTMSMLRREVMPENGWDESIEKLQDWDFFLTIAENGKQGMFIDMILFTIKPGGTISSWVPSFFYKLFPFLPVVKKYNKALEIVKNKHKL
ncbi:glycosyltransferase family 2 protein [Patescibacteria group bacterium]|nr:glycosyltransferase family 2 protein [Patescibacteria group bacterium]